MRTFGYICVSKEREDMISLEIQRDEIEHYCRQKGWTVAEWFEDIDVSGRAWNRPKRKALDELMAQALAGECETVVFYRIDRHSPEEADFHVMLAALRRAGMHCDSPSNWDHGSHEADLIRSISAALAKHGSARLAAGWATPAVSWPVWPRLVEKPRSRVLDEGTDLTGKSVGPSLGQRTEHSDHVWD